MPKYWPRRSAVSALIARSPCTMPRMRFDGTRKASASAFMLRPRGLSSSSFKYSPGVMSGNRSALVVVRDFDIVCFTFLPFETDAVLIIDSDAVLALTITLESLQAITGRDQEIIQLRRSFEGIEPPLRNHRNCLQLLRPNTICHLLGVFVPV